VLVVGCAVRCDYGGGGELQTQIWTHGLACNLYCAEIRDACWPVASASVPVPVASSSQLAVTRSSSDIRYGHGAMCCVELCGVCYVLFIVCCILYWRRRSHLPDL
jgi:hypothetical protein